MSRLRRESAMMRWPCPGGDSGASVSVELETLLTRDEGGSIGHREKPLRRDGGAALGAHSIFAIRYPSQRVSQALGSLGQPGCCQVSQLLELDALGDIEEVATRRLCFRHVRFALESRQNEVKVGLEHTLGRGGLHFYHRHLGCQKALPGCRPHARQLTRFGKTAHLKNGGLPA